MIELERLGLAWEINGAEITWSFFSCSAWKEGNQEDERQTGERSFNSENLYSHFQYNDILNGVADYHSPMISITLRRLAITHISDFMIRRVIKTRDCNLTPLFCGHCTAAADFSSTRRRMVVLHS